MTKFYLQIEPYVYISRKKDLVLLYNTLSGDTVILKNKEISLVLEDLEEQNFRFFPVSEQLLLKEDFKNFIREIRSKYIGDLLNEKVTNGNAVQFDPFLQIEEEEKGDNLEREFKGSSSGKYLFEFSLLLNGRCNQDCVFCKSAHKQFLCCTKNDYNEMDLELILKLLNYTTLGNFNQINILGGDIFLYSHFRELHENLLNKKIKVNFYCLVENYLDYIIGNKLTLSSSQYLVLLSSVQSLEMNINRLNAIGMDFTKAHFQVPVSSESDWEECYKYQQLDFPIEVVPFYNQDNFEFFSENVFVNEEDIFETVHSQDDINRNMKINSNFFGKLIVRNNGDVFSNSNLLSLGNIQHENIFELIEKEMKNRGAWINLRNLDPCKSCIYQYFCPPISNYEFVFNRSNLCNLKEGVPLFKEQ